MVFGEEPVRVTGTVVRDKPDGVDVITSAILEYPSGHCVLSCSMDTALNQRMRFYGTGGGIEVEIPFTAPPDRPTRIVIDDNRDVLGTGRTVEEFPVCNQYTIQGDLFSKAVREGGAPPNTLEDALANMAVIDAIYRGAAKGTWENVTTSAAASQR
jgi:predicted dehydrogenase